MVVTFSGGVFEKFSRRVENFLGGGGLRFFHRGLRCFWEGLKFLHHRLGFDPEGLRFS